MNTVGDDNAGFTVSATRGTISVRAWGFWSVDVAHVFMTTVAETCLLVPPGASLVMDMTDLKPMRDEGQQSFAELIRALPRFGITQAWIATASHLTKLQLLRLVTQHAGKCPVTFVAPEDLKKAC